MTILQRQIENLTAKLRRACEDADACAAVNDDTDWALNKVRIDRLRKEITEQRRN